MRCWIVRRQLVGRTFGRSTLPPPLWCQPELASAAFSPWGAVRAALVHALNDPEVGLNSSRVSDITFQDLDEYYQNGCGHRDDEELAEHFAVLDDGVRALVLHAGTFMHCALLIGAGAEGLMVAAAVGCSCSALR